MMFSRKATFRTRRPLNASFQLCVWDAVVFPPCPPPAGSRLLLGHFVGSTWPSDFPAACMLDFWLMNFSNRPDHVFLSGVDGTSRFSRMKFPCMPGVIDPTGGGRPLGIIKQYVEQQKTPL